MISSILCLPHYTHMHACMHVLLFQEPQPTLEHKSCQSISSEHVMQTRKKMCLFFFSPLPFQESNLLQGDAAILVFNSVRPVPFQSSSGTSVSTKLIVFRKTTLCLLSCTADSSLLCAQKISGCPFSGLNQGSAHVDKATRPSVRWIIGVSRIRNRLVKIVDFIVNENK